MYRIFFTNANRYVDITSDDYYRIKEAIKTKEKFVELYDNSVEFINLDLVDYIIELSE